MSEEYAKELEERKRNFNESEFVDEVVTYLKDGNVLSEGGYELISLMRERGSIKTLKDLAISLPASYVYDRDGSNTVEDCVRRAYTQIEYLLIKGIRNHRLPIKTLTDFQSICYPDNPKKADFTSDQSSPDNRFIRRFNTSVNPTELERGY